MPENRKTLCPDCGLEMNRHAEKVSYTAGLLEPEAVDADLGGVIEEAHTCPGCGRTRMQRAAQAMTQE